MSDTRDELDSLLPSNCPSPYFDTWDRHNSIAFSATKGLRNAPGENNCFVNCAVQVFWHLDVFRRSYRRLLGHTCMGNSCIFCALKVIFTQFQYSDKTSLHPDALRKALAETFANQQRFQLGHMDDAAECFENILRRIHFHIARSQNEDTCTAPHCLPHQKFSMAVYEKVVCPCGASSSPLKFNEMVHYVSASALVAQCRMMHENGDVLHPDRFGLLLRKASAMGDVRNCPAGCGKQVQKQRTLLNIPDVVSIGLVWDSDHPSIETTTEVAGALGTAILLQDMYHRVMPDIRILPRLQLVAIVCYYGKHYSTFVFHSKLRTWIYFDDATVREIGPQWENVVEKCSRGRFQPLLLLYANPSASPVSVDTAPRKRVMAPGYAPMPVVIPPEDSDSGLDRTQESIKTTPAPNSALRSVTPSREHVMQDASHSMQDASRGQRSVTPGLESASSQEKGKDSPVKLSREHSRQPSFLIAVTGKTDKNKSGENIDGGSHLPGGASPFPGQHINGRDQKIGASRTLLDGGASSGRLETMPEDDYTDYTLSSGDQYRRPSLNGFDHNQLPLPPNSGRYPEAQRKESFKRGNSKEGKGGADIVRYQVDPNRATNRTPDPSIQKNGQMLDNPHGKVSNGQRNAAHPRHGSVSGREEEGTGEHSSGVQHVVVKPKPTGHGHPDAVDGGTHTPVQSGLATLPRKKGQSNADPVSHSQQGPPQQEVARLTHGPSLGNLHFVEPPLPPGTPPPEYNTVVEPQHPHSRQTSTSSQASTIKASSSMGQIEQSLTSKKPEDKMKKKIKKEKKEKSEKDPSKKGEKKKSTKSDSALRKSESAHDLTDKSRSYIDRRMVETILKHQGVHRQNSSCSNNSVSSSESDSLMGKLLNSKAAGSLTVDIPYDNVSLGSHKDSGYGSSDRNSSSSTGSGTIDPYTQYFISKSMVVPRSVNQQALEQYQQLGKGSGDPYGGHGGQTHMSQHKDAGGLPHGEGRKIMHPIKESSQEDFLRMSPEDEPIGTKKFITAPPPAPSDPRPPPVPPKNFAQFHVIKSSQPAHQRESSLDSLDKDENINDRFVSLCKKADTLMDNCMLAETREDIPASLCYCDSALGCLKEAMAHKDLNSKALAYVQKKHNSCLLKARTLQKRMPVRQESNQSTISSDVPPSVGNRSSITSSDSDMSDQMAKQLRLDAARERQDARNKGQDLATVMHERQGSAGHRSAHNPNRQGQASSYNGGPASHNSSPSRGVQENALHHHRTDSGVSRTSTSHSANYVQASSSGMDTAGNTADIYGTLPRNKSRKPSSEAAASPEVYQSFLNKQKCLQAGVHSSQQSLDSVKSDSGGSDHGSPSGGQQRINKSEIRQLLQDNLVQRQRQQNGSTQQQQEQQHGRRGQLQQQAPHQVAKNISQHAGGQYHTHQQQFGQYHPQEGQYPPNQGAQYPPQHHRQGTNMRHTQPVPPNWQQQQQQQPFSQHHQQQQQSSHQHLSQQQQYHHQVPHHQPPQQQQQQSASSSHYQNSRQPAKFPPQMSSAEPPPGQHGPQGPPPVPSQKPTIPYPSSLAKSRTSAAGLARPEQTEVGRRGSAQNVAFVPPNSHLGGLRPAVNSSGGSYLVMMPPSQQPQHQLQPLPGGGQMRHAASSMQLSGLLPGSKPLERSASQPDCQKLVDSAYPANMTDASSSVYGGRDKLTVSPISLSASQPDPAHLHESRTSSVTSASASSSSPVSDLPSPSAVSVRALASRFETSDCVAAPIAGSRQAGPRHHVQSDQVEKPQGQPSVQRTRSKSESFSRKPKSVLKNKKNKSRQRKSVTFGDSITHYTDCDEPNSGYESARELGAPRVTDDRAYYSDDEERLGSHVSYSDNELDDVEDTNSSNSDDSPVGEDEACQLCHKRRNDPGNPFCAKCSFYMGKLKSS